MRSTVATPPLRRLTVLVTAAVLGGGTVAAASATAAPAVTRTGHGPSTSLPYKNPHLPTERRVADLLARMTLAEKVGQMTQAERGGIDADPSQITTLGLGSVLSGGGSVPSPNTPTAWADMVDRYQRAALGSRLGIPLVYGVDSVHGHGNLDGATVFPHNIGLGATRDPALVERVAHITAEETRATGPQWAFAPCVCVARDDRWGRTYESFGETPELVTTMETAIRGLQGRRGQLDDPDRVLATAKHFAGDGLTTYGTGSNSQQTGNYPVDQGVDQVSRRTFDRLALDPYRPAIHRWDVGSVMPSYSDVDWTEDGLGNPVNMHGNRELLSGWLKEKQGFDGFVISDYEGIHHIDPGSTYAHQVETGVNAGVDMFMEPYDFRDFTTTLTAAVQAGRVPMARVDDAVSRILTKKFELGLFEHPYTDRRNLDDVGSAAHRKVAREAVQKSQVLLKNDRKALPLSDRRPVYVAGSNADNIGNQAGGWTLTWQGGSTTDIPGQTILDGIRGESRRVTFSEDASAPVPRGAVGVVVVGETPYSEGFGDVGGPSWSSDPGDAGQPRPAKTMELSAADSRAVDTVCAKASTCVVLVVSGRPVVIPPAQLRHIDALVASWLPGSEGRGVSDVLFGDAPFTGKLPLTWPRSVAQEPINVGDRGYDPAFAYGWGLRTRGGHHGHDDHGGRGH
ncbi:glycoside hydrolase family 3 protein [Phycicoccus avicenniae]|uniref:glycoside hydrolase family 3 protein n=1 Tax=Phycicoccus avicenniae TaxID=2828860 RepID=UPI003D264FEA